MSEDAFDELAFVPRSAFDTSGERKTGIIGESDDFRNFAPLGGPNREAPFFVPAREASMKASSMQFPSGLQLLRQHMPDALQLALPHRLLKTAVQVGYGGFSLGSSRHCAPYANPTGFG